MPKAEIDKLFALIKSLSKAEKRNFKLFAARISKSEGQMFVKLFDLIDQSDEYSDSDARFKLGKISKIQLSNLKRHLFTQILKSLRIISTEKYHDIKLREQLDFARILYGKGLYMEALKLLHRLKSIFSSSNEYLLHLEILEFEKMIENRHITRSRKIKNRMESLINESKAVVQTVNKSSQLLNLNLKIHGMYIKIGHIKDYRDLIMLSDFYKANLPKFNERQLNHFEKVHYYLSFLWFHYTALNFPFCYKYSSRVVDIFLRNDHMMIKDPDLFMRGVHYLLVTLFYMRQTERYEFYFNKFMEFKEQYQSKFNRTTEMVFFIYGNNAVTNYFILKNDYPKALDHINMTHDKIQMLERNFDHHRKMVVLYKRAWILFVCNDLSKCLDDLNEIINSKKDQLRDDLFCYAKLMHLIAHYELEHFELVTNLIPSVRRLLARKGTMSESISLVLEYLRWSSEIRGSRDVNKITQLHNKLMKLRLDRFEQRSFMLFNFTFWLEYKMKNKSMLNILAEADS